MAPRNQSTSPISANTAELAHPMQAVLHTVRCIAQHEDQLCTLWHATKSRKSPGARFFTELTTLLEDMPSPEEYASDLYALQDFLPQPAPAPKKTPPPKPLRKAAAANKFAATKPAAKKSAKKKSRRGARPSK